MSRTRRFDPYRNTLRAWSLRRTLGLFIIILGIAIALVAVQEGLSDSTIGRVGVIIVALGTAAYAATLGSRAVGQSRADTAELYGSTGAFFVTSAGLRNASTVVEATMPLRSRAATFDHLPGYLMLFEDRLCWHPGAYARNSANGFDVHYSEILSVEIGRRTLFNTADSKFSLVDGRTFELLVKGPEKFRGALARTSLDLR